MQGFVCFDIFDGSLKKAKKGKEGRCKGLGFDIQNSKFKIRHSIFHIPYSIFRTKLAMRELQD